MLRNILITGASGLLGRALFREFSRASRFSVSGTALRRAVPPLLLLDLMDDRAVRDAVIRLKPSCIVHSAAERRPEAAAADTGRSRRLNVEATERLAGLARETGAFLIYISTDYVFDGENPPYHPQDPPHPLNFYGRTKWEGEERVREETGDHAILRVSILYGEVESLEESAVTVGAKHLFCDGPTPVDDWAVRYPIPVDDVARVCLWMTEHRHAHPGFHGTFHWAGNEPFTKYGMALEMGKIFSLETSHLVPVHEPGEGEPRPRDTRLDCSILERLGAPRRTPFREAIVPVLRPFMKVLDQ